MRYFVCLDLSDYIIIMKSKTLFRIKIVISLDEAPELKSMEKWFRFRSSIPFYTAAQCNFITNLMNKAIETQKRFIFLINPMDVKQASCHHWLKWSNEIDCIVFIWLLLLLFTNANGFEGNRNRIAGMQLVRLIYLFLLFTTMVSCYVIDRYMYILNGIRQALSSDSYRKSNAFILFSLMLWN